MTHPHTTRHTVVSLTVQPSVRAALDLAADAAGVTLAAWMDRATKTALATLDALAPERLAATFAGVPPARLARVLAHAEARRAAWTPEEADRDARTWPLLDRPGWEWIEPAAWTKEAPTETVAFRLSPGLAHRAAAAAVRHATTRNALLEWAARLSLVGSAHGGQVQRERDS